MIQLVFKECIQVLICSKLKCLKQAENENLVCECFLTLLYAKVKIEINFEVYEVDVSVIGQVL